MSSWSRCSWTRPDTPTTPPESPRQEPASCRLAGAAAPRPSETLRHPPRMRDSDGKSGRSASHVTALNQKIDPAVGKVQQLLSTKTSAHSRVSERAAVPAHGQDPPGDINETYERRRRQASLGRLTPIEYQLIRTTTATH